MCHTCGDISPSSSSLLLLPVLLLHPSSPPPHTHVSPGAADQVPADVPAHLQDTPRGPQPHGRGGGGVHRADGECAAGLARGALHPLAEEVARRERDPLAVLWAARRGNIHIDAHFDVSVCYLFFVICFFVVCCLWRGGLSLV